MYQAPKPIKRSVQLAPLSREHHDGLLFAWKLKQGLRKSIDASRMASFVQWFWQHHLSAHFEKEERVLPAVLSTSHPFMQQMFQEHAQLKNLVEEIGGYGDLKKIETLAQLINDHIRFEERQLFGEVEKAASAAQSDALTIGLQDDMSEAVWTDEFWLYFK